ncbi:Stage II sporulation protein [Lentibacillus sp. JNUCC-1]|uniref:stage II sporulation protein R n=1 Tax=Lentibacillus sp. JNUCC-1 TaxID=2654513 RepID=UPI0012E900EC|nr:stage II sporulation protein R [Lentibacillus sp. JNUCC-1]MUV37405.1 Stage II sporulation protein [Lentibacillus sp. JNUCC-1]
MRQVIFIAMISVILLFSMPNQGVTQQAGGESFQVIPDEAIRLRILANSDSEKDQELKHKVRDAVNDQINGWVEHLTDIQTARDLIASRIPDIQETVAGILNEQRSEQSYEVSYGENVNFPVKLYGSYVYPAGEYEAVLITLGEGQGANWWCVLFPPLCFLDFSNGTSTGEDEAEEEPGATEQVTAHADDQEDDGVKIKFFLFDWLGWS